MEETMSKPSVIIIGAGLGGLSSGTYGQMNGYQCRIFEHARHPIEILNLLLASFGLQ
jgi:monoamine oxidase